MGIDRDEKNQDWAKDDVQWTKEEAKRDPWFDFAPFLGPESLEDKVTDALDGKDLLDKEAYGEYPPDYVPRRGAPGERGRHEAPGPDPEEEEPTEEEDQPDDDGMDARRFNSEDLDLDLDMDNDGPEFHEEPPRRAPIVDEPPPRPKVVVAQPAPKVFVRPPSEYPPEEPQKGGSKGLKWLIALLIAAVVVVAAVLAVTTLLPGAGGQTQTPSTTHSSLLDGLLRPRPTQVPAAVPTDPPAPSAPPATKTYIITVTAGSGGSVSPSGRVEVDEGGYVTFTITPQVGYELGQLLIDGSNVSVQNSYTFYDVRQDHSIYAVFQQMQTPATEAPPPTAEPTAEPVPETTPEPPPPMEGEVGNLGPALTE